MVPGVEIEGISGFREMALTKFERTAGFLGGICRRRRRRRRQGVCGRRAFREGSGGGSCGGFERRHWKGGVEDRTGGDWVGR